MVADAIDTWGVRMAQDSEIEVDQTRAANTQRKAVEDETSLHNPLTTTVEETIEVRVLNTMVMRTEEEIETLMKEKEEKLLITEVSQEVEENTIAQDLQDLKDQDTQAIEVKVVVPIAIEEVRGRWSKRTVVKITKMRKKVESKTTTVMVKIMINMSIEIRKPRSKMWLELKTIITMLTLAITIPRKMRRIIEYLNQ